MSFNQDIKGFVNFLGGLVKENPQNPNPLNPNTQNPNPQNPNPQNYPKPKGIKAVDFENSVNRNSTEFIRDLSVQLLEQIEKGNIIDSNDIMTFIKNNSNFKFNNLLYMLFYYNWIGGEKCRKIIDSKCLKSIRDFNFVTNSYNKFFFPFFMVELKNRNQQLTKYINSNPNYFLITLSSNTPHNFRIYYNVNGKVFEYGIGGEYDVSKAINNYVLEFNQKMAEAKESKETAKDNEVQSRKAKEAQRKQEEPKQPEPKQPEPKQAESKQEAKVQGQPPAKQKPIPPPKPKNLKVPVPPAKEILKIPTKPLDRKKKSWIIDEVLKYASNDSDFKSNPEKLKYIDEVFSQNSIFKKNDTLENKIFLYYWLGLECEKNKDTCKNNINKIANISKKFDDAFEPFYQTNNRMRNDKMLEEITKNNKNLIVTLSSSDPGVFITVYKDPKTLQPVLRGLYNDNDFNDLITILSANLNKIVNMPNPTVGAPAPAPQEKYIFKIGPANKADKYGVISEIGSGTFGVNYKARNLDKQKDEQDLYAVKLLKYDPRNPITSKAKNSWERERQCLMDVIDICKQGGILCYKDSFIFKDINRNEFFVIITPFLEGYITLTDIFTKYSVDKNEAKNIYQQIINTKNKLADICIYHSDLNPNNIMYNPKTKDVKIIDLGLCKAPYEKNIFESDTPEEQHLSNIRNQLFLISNRRYGKNNDEIDNFFGKPKITTPKPGCKRVNKKL